MKKLIIINGTMGVGKTETCKLLNEKLSGSLWLDGDWCSMMNPFVVNDENKLMVINNITTLLRNFLSNSSFPYVIFNWVIHEERIFTDILDPLAHLNFEVIKITLMCSEAELSRRILKDIDAGKRTENSLQRSIERLKMYQFMDTIKIDTTTLSIEDTVNKILDIIKGV